MRAMGICTVAQVAALSAEALDAIPGIGPATAHRIRRYAEAMLQQRAIWMDALPPVCRRPGLMFDLETDPETRDPWSLGWCDPDGNVMIALLAPGMAPGTLRLEDGSHIVLATDNDAVWQVFCDAAMGDTPIYHWTGYDAGIMRQYAPEHVRAHLTGRMHDLHATFRRTVALPQRSTSLKPVARYLGFEWPDGAESGMGWWLAWRDYQTWRFADDAAALARACRYQRADVDALALVWRWMQAEG